jgi:hypothetical protein
MRKHTWDQRRDATVHLLARLSLVVVLAVLGALFVGGAATSDASGSASGSAGSAGSAQQSLLEQASPIGLLLGAVVIGAGIVVLVVGAVKPPAGRELEDATTR